jgi:hypothetical protein
MKALPAKELLPKTVLNVMVVLKEMFKHEVQWGYLEPIRPSTRSGRRARTRRCRS